MTSIFGTILTVKIDSTKKVCIKLQGECTNIVSWTNNMDNKQGEAIISVLTESESAVALQPLPESLGDRIPKPIKEHSELPRETLICKCADSKRTKSARQRVKKLQSIVERQ